MDQCKRPLHQAAGWIWVTEYQKDDLKLQQEPHL